MTEPLARIFINNTLIHAIEQLRSGKMTNQGFERFVTAAEEQVSDLADHLTFVRAARSIGQKIGAGTASKDEIQAFSSEAASFAAKTVDGEMTGRSFISHLTTDQLHKLETNDLDLDGFNEIVDVMEANAFLSGHPAYFKAVRQLAVKVLAVANGEDVDEPEVSATY